MSTTPAAATSQPDQLPVHLFVYGTLKLGQPNDHVMLNADGDGGVQYTAAGRTVESFPLVIATSANIPFLLNRPGQGHRVFGHVACVRTARALAKLDQFEACPELYRRQPVNVELLGSLPAPDGQAAAHAGCPLGDLAGPAGAVAACQMYVFAGADGHMLALPRLEDYRSEGNHGLPYLTERDDVRSPEQVATQEVS